MIMRTETEIFPKEVGNSTWWHDHAWQKNQSTNIVSVEDAGLLDWNASVQQKTLNLSSAREQITVLTMIWKRSVVNSEGAKKGEREVYRFRVIEQCLKDFSRNLDIWMIWLATDFKTKEKKQSDQPEGQSSLHYDYSHRDKLSNSKVKVRNLDPQEFTQEK